MSDVAQRVFNRTKFMQVMKYSVINYWGSSWDVMERAIDKHMKEVKNKLAKGEK